MYKKFSSITSELLEVIKLHTTVSSIRRACATALQIIEEEATELCPRLFYVTYSPNPKSEDWEVHACECDICEYLLGLGAEEGSGEGEGGDTPEPEDYKSTISWDGVIGGKDLVATVVDRHDGVTHHSVQCLQLGGTIAYDEDLGENLVGIILTLDQERVKLYGLPKLSNSEYIRWEPTKDPNILHGLVTVVIPGQSDYIELTWSDDEIEEFGVEVYQETKIQANVITTEDELSWALSHNSRILIGDDIQIYNPISIPSGAHINLNLNSHKLEFYGEYGLLNSGYLTVHDGELVGSDNTKNCLQNDVDGVLVINNVQIDHVVEGSPTDGISAVYNYRGTLTILGDTKITSVNHCVISRGEWNSSSPNLIEGLTPDASAVTTILNGKFESSSESAYPIFNMDNSLLNIEGGEFIGCGGVAVYCAKVNLNAGVYKASELYGLYMINSEGTYNESCEIIAPEFKVYINTESRGYKYPSTLNGVQYSENYTIS